VVVVGTVVVGTSVVGGTVVGTGTVVEGGSVVVGTSWAYAVAAPTDTLTNASKAIKAFIILKYLSYWVLDKNENLCIC
jgi:hypothetical protein